MKSVNKFFQNKIVLYILLILSLLNLLGYLAQNNLSAIIIFLSSGYVTTFFTKNMSYIFLVPLLLTNLLVYIFSMRQLSVTEGLDNNKTKKNSHNKKEALNEKDDETNNKNKNVTNSDENDEIEYEADPLDDTGDDEDEDENKVVENNDSYTNKNKSNKSSPASVNKQENVIDNLSKITGNQQSTAEALKQLQMAEPLMKRAENFLAKMESSPLMGRLIHNMLGEPKK